MRRTQVNFNRFRNGLLGSLALMLVAVGCGSADEETAESDSEPETTLTHQFDPYTLESGEETVPCVQWTLNNEKPLYVNEVTLANEGFFHHSNWFVAPEDYAAGEDGYFNCDDRGFSEFGAASQGTVLFAQSTQALEESQDLPDGVTIKIPANSKIVADVHFLNVSPREVSTTARMSLDLVHPKDVETVATPFRLSYYDLQIPPTSESRFTGECNFRGSYEATSDESFDDFRLFYVLPHYHEKGSYFGLEKYGGSADGEQIFELSGFNAEANGQAFEPPVTMENADGFRFTCGYDNPTDRTVTWGLGGSEMCVMLGFADSDMIIDASVSDETSLQRSEDGVDYFSSPECSVLPLQGSEATTPPTEAEKNAEFYKPESSDDDQLDPVPDCEDADPQAEPLREPTLTNVQQQIFGVNCTYSSCHDVQGPTGNLNLTAEGDLHDRLLSHEMVTPTDKPLVDPGNPTNSWLYTVLSTCNPKAGELEVSHMPRNSPTLLDDELVAMVREWIAQGAKDN